MNIISSETYADDLNTCFYADSNEKSVLRDKLNNALHHFHGTEAIDFGAGPGLVSAVLQQHAKNLTLVDISRGYYPVLKKKFPEARIEIQSILDFEFTQQYDLMLLSHVLYYIATDEWKPLLKKLHDNLAPLGRLVIVHSPCHRLHEIFKTTLVPHSTFAYLSEPEVNKIMNDTGSHTRDGYHSISYFNGEPTPDFAMKFMTRLFGLNEKDMAVNCDEQLGKLLTQFKPYGDKLAFEFHSDMYIFQK